MSERGHILGIIHISDDPYDEEAEAQGGEKDSPRAPSEATTLSELIFFVLIKRRNFPHQLGFWRMRHKEGRSLVGTLKGKPPKSPSCPKALSERF